MTFLMKSQMRGDQDKNVLIIGSGATIRIVTFFNEAIWSKLMSVHAGSDNSAMLNIFFHS